MRKLPSVKLTTVLFTGLLAFSFLHSSTSEFDSYETLASQVFLLLFIYSVASLVFRLGWVVPCVLLGVLTCMFWETCVPPMGRSDRVKMDAGIWRMVLKISIGFVVGFLMGIGIDSNQRCVPDKSTKGEVET